MNIFLKLYIRIINRLKLDLEFNPRTSNILLLSQDGYVHNTVKLTDARLLGNVKIGNNAKVIGGVLISAKEKSEIHVGRYTSINGPNTNIFAMLHNIKIGSFCSIARSVQFQEFNHISSRFTTYYFHNNILKESGLKDVESKGEILVGNDVWIGTQSVILTGAKIGNGAVIAANSVVTGEIPPYAIAAGSPAKVIKYRFEPERIRQLEQLNWWDWPIEKIIENRDLL